MNAPKKFHFKTPLLLLRGGLALTILTIVLVSYHTVHEMRLLNRASQDLYQHPFLVTNAVLELQHDVAQMRILMLQIGSAGSVTEVEALAGEVQAYSNDTVRQLNILSGEFLGDMSRVHDLGLKLQNWTRTRTGIIDKAMNGSLSSEDRAELSRGTVTYQKLFEDINYISNFARNRAQQFISEANKRSSNAIQNLIWLTAAVILMLLAGAVFVFRTINTYINELKDHAHFDPLTGLLNRRQFHVLADHEFAKLARDKHDMSVMIIDIDYFKRINDQHGHAVGDAILISLAKMLREELRANELLCRWGGEEIVLLLPGIGEAKALSISRRLNMRIAGTAVQVGSSTVNFTVSIGVASLDGHANVSQLISQADIALYHVKNNGRNGSIAYSSIAESEPRDIQAV